MNSRLSFLCSALTLSVLAGNLVEAAPAPRPNIIFILTDDLGTGDVGVFYQNARRAANDRAEPWHMTPNLDAMAAQGVQLPQHYCPASVCAPSRASLLLGVHQGHANVRDNQFDKTLERNHTLATILKQAGYATASIGKWGLQGARSANAPHGWPAHPQNRGFDSYFGYISHRAGHFHYPKEDGQALWDGDKDVVADYDRCYTTDLFTARAKKWISEQHAQKPQQPFFLYLAYDTPHAKLQYPPGPFPTGGGLRGGVQWLGQPGKMINTADGTPDSYCHPDYANATWDNDKNPATPEQPWPDVYKRHATDVRRIDDNVGDILHLLKDLKVDDNTLVIFTSDNGPSQESYLPQNYDPSFFNTFGPHDGIKRDLLEGGIRVGAIARAPGLIPGGRLSGQPSAFWDWMPTFAELAGVPAPARTDGVSLVPTLTGNGVQQPSIIYSEYFVAGKTPSYLKFLPAHQGRVRRQMQALRLGDYMGVRYNIAGQSDPFEIYNVVNDPQEKNNLATDPTFATLQQQLHDTVLRLRRPDVGAPRPYDNELVPAIKPANTTNGLAWQAVEQEVPWAAKIDGLKPFASGIKARPDTALGEVKPSKSNVGFLFSGYIEVPKDGEYTFSISTNSKALLRIHEAIVLDAGYDYNAGGEEKSTIRLQAGKHPFRLYYARHKTGQPSLDLKWSSAETPMQEIPASAFSH